MVDHGYASEKACRWGWEMGCTHNLGAGHDDQGADVGGEGVPLPFGTAGAPVHKEILSTAVLLHHAALCPGLVADKVRPRGYHVAKLRLRDGGRETGRDIPPLQDSHRIIPW